MKSFYIRYTIGLGLILVGLYLAIYIGQPFLIKLIALIFVAAGITMVSVSNRYRFYADLHNSNSPFMKKLKNLDSMLDATVNTVSFFHNNRRVYYNKGDVGKNSLQNTIESLVEGDLTISPISTNISNWDNSNRFIKKGSAGAGLEFHSHLEAEKLFVEKGKIQLIINRDQEHKIVILNKGDEYLIDPNIMHSVRFLEDSKVAIEFFKPLLTHEIVGD